MSQSTLKVMSKFYGYTTPLCNLRYSKMMVNDIEYNSLEQYINARKAEHFHDEEARERIMGMIQPMGCRWVRVRGFVKEEWAKVVEEILFDGVFAKV